MVIFLGTSAASAMVLYLRDGRFEHADCTESAKVQVTVRLEGVADPRIDSVELWSCDACGINDEVRNPEEHATLADALRRLPPPPPGELDADDLAAQMFLDMDRARADSGAEQPGGPSGSLGNEARAETTPRRITEGVTP